jgi:hypothetical protein
MRINGQIIKLLVSVLFISLIPISANSAQKVISGTTCKTLNLKIHHLNKVYTCIRSGKKLLWNKGIAIAKPKVSPFPSTSPSPAPTAISDPIILRVSQALNSELPSVDLSKIDDSAIGQLIVEPGISKQSVQITKTLMKQLYAAQPVMKLAKSPIVILGHTEAFIKSEFSKVCSDNISWIGSGNSTMEKYQNWASAGCLSSNPTQLIPMPKGEVVVSHIAGALGSDMGYIAIGLGPDTKNLPGWFVRGLKGVVGEYMASQGKSEWQISDNGARGCLTKTLEQVSDSYENTGNWCQTSLGQSVARYMVSLKGLNKTLEFINKLQAKGSWAPSDFTNYLGISFETFEAEARDYITRQFK